MSLPAYPSPVVSVQITGDSAGGPFSWNVRLPQDELFRADEIFSSAEYSIPELRSHTGALTVVDVGANVGLFALYMKLVDPAAVICCYEPVPGTFALLQENIAALPGVSTHPFALSNGSGDVPMHLNRHNTGQNSMKASGTDYPESIVVSCRDAGEELDSIDHVDVLKVDTEGCEVEILDSLAERLDEIDYVLVEYHSEADRRRIDAQLDDFYLYASRSERLGCGVVRYLNPRLLGR